ncbi:MAG: methionine gamma-lyase family protein [Candidatus Caenarcaniphilales bacterium]|nr:methionine gamma-lyase family protein [Candidatus Caenarcaniphilales bacterium]
MNKRETVIKDQLKTSPEFIVQSLESQISSKFHEFQEISFFNHKKVALAFKELKVGTEHFVATSGYGHDDIGREKFDQVFAKIFNAEAGLARVNFVSGTHAIACAILGNLKPKDEIVFALDRPYDTLDSLINYLEKDLQVKVKIIDHENWLDFGEVIETVTSSLTKDTSMVCIQRSRGYSANRPSVNINQLQELIQSIKSINPETICFVDNCYGEFVEKQEPSDVGADLVAGSLIKNPGGGIVLTGGYVVGRKSLIDNTANRLTCPGIGSEGGPNFNQGRLLFQGLYMAPLIVLEILKGSLLTSKVCEYLSIQSLPGSQDSRTDTILRLDLKSKERLLSFCKLLQENSPVDSHLTPFPDNTPGYSDELIMAAGTFIEGSTSELSADGPIREPYSVYLQGGLSYLYTKIFLEKLIEKFEN